MISCDRSICFNRGVARFSNLRVLKIFGVHCRVLGVQLIYSQQDSLIFDGALTLAQVEKHANYLLLQILFHIFFSVNSS